VDEVSALQQPTPVSCTLAAQLHHSVWACLCSGKGYPDHAVEPSRQGDCSDDLVLHRARLGEKYIAVSGCIGARIGARAVVQDGL